MPNGKQDYKMLMSVAQSKGFDFDQLVNMYVAESSGRADVVNPIGYVGGFQFGSKAGEEYGLVGEGFDYRKDLEKSASAAIDMYRKQTKGMGSRVERLIKERGLSPSIVGYLTHQQGRFGFQDIITGAESGRVKKSTRDHMLVNVGDQDLSNLSDKELANRFLEFWKGRYSKKVQESELWRQRNRPEDDIAFAAIQAQSKPLF